MRPLFWVMPLLTGLYAVSGSHIAAQELQARVKRTTAIDELSTSGVVFHAGTGLGLFQDVQVPLSTRQGVRADGKTQGETNANHLGSVLQFGVTLRGGTSSKFSYDADAQYLTMRAISGPAETQSASYGRFNIMGGVRYAWGLADWRPTVSLHGILRRNSFNNVSNGHYVNAALVRSGVGFWNPSMSVEAFLSYAPYSEFGYNPGKGIFGGKKLKSGQTDLSELGLTYSYRVAEAVWIDLGVEQEMVQTLGARGDDYDGFGLSVERADAGRRDMSFATSTARLGFRKQF